MCFSDQSELRLCVKTLKQEAVSPREMSWENNHKEDTKERRGQNHNSYVSYWSEITPAVIEEETGNRMPFSLKSVWLFVYQYIE